MEEKQERIEGGGATPKGETLEAIEKEVKKPRPKAKKRRPGRPTETERKAREAEEAEERATENEMMILAIGGGISAFCDLLLAPRLGAHWKLKESEKRALGEAWAPPFNRWIPTLFKNHPEETKAAIVTFGIFAPRVERTKEIMAAQMAKAEKEKAPVPPPGGLTKEQEAHNIEAAKR